MSQQKTVLVANPDQRERETVCRALEGEGLHFVITRNMYEALDRIDRLRIDILVAPLKGDRLDGLELMEAARQKHPDVGVIFMTNHNVLETDVGIRAMLHHEASYFMPRPPNPVHLKALLHKILENQRLTAENRQLQSQIDDREGLLRLTGHSQHIQEVRETIAQVAPTRSTVMVRGERGTGKELVARAIHHRSLRRGPLVAFNCAALNESLAESELFGYERGAFTGADQQRKGKFESANGGTLLLDDIGELSLSNQARLLRVLAEREFHRVGGNEVVRVDVRVICATNRILEEAVKAGKFMADLYDRLNVISIDLPPLRERKGDIPLLVKTFIEEFCQENRKAPKSIAPEAQRVLMKYDWPGNVRELRNCIEGMIVMSNSRELDLADLPERVLKFTGISTPIVFSAPTAVNAESAVHSDRRLNVEIGMSMEEIKEEAIRATLEYVGNNRAKAAKILGVNKRTIFRKIKEYDLCDD